MNAENNTLSELWANFSRHIYQELEINPAPEDIVEFVDDGVAIRIMPGIDSKYFLYFDNKREFEQKLAEYGMRLKSGPDENKIMEIVRL